MSFSTVKSAAMEGLAVEIVYVEADVSNGLPVFHMVGYLSSEVKEAAERVRSAVRNSGLEFPAKRVVINLSPATMRKRGASFDLPIAVAILTSLGVLQQNRRMKDCMIIGELGLDGQVRKVPGILSMVSEAKVQKVTSCIVPRENEKEAELVEGVRIIAVGSLRECISYLEHGDRTGGEQRSLGEKEADKMEDRGKVGEEVPDFADLYGQENVRRAAEIAVAGEVFDNHAISFALFDHLHHFLKCRAIKQNATITIVNFFCHNLNFRVSGYVVIDQAPLVSNAVTFYCFIIRIRKTDVLNRFVNLHKKHSFRCTEKSPQFKKCG